MKLRKGKARYKIPDHSRIEYIFINGNERRNQMASYILQMVDISELGSVDVKKPLGRPIMVGVYENIIEFEPVPDKPYRVTVRYYPPVAEV